MLCVVNVSIDVRQPMTDNIACNILLFVVVACYCYVFVPSNVIVINMYLFMVYVCCPCALCLFLNHSSNESMLD